MESNSEYKICSKCGRKLPLEAFQKDRQKKDGLSCACKECKNKLYKTPKRSEMSFERRQRYLQTERKYRQTEKYKEAARRRRKENKEYCNMLYKKCRERGTISKWYKRKRKEDISFAISSRFKARLNQAIKNKKGRSLDFLGCSWDDFLKYLESKFQSGMTWENRDLWDIDHIIPVSYFRKMNLDMKICFHYLNLQPLWKEENRWKKKIQLPENYLERIEGIKTYINS